MFSGENLQNLTKHKEDTLVWLVCSVVRAPLHEPGHGWIPGRQMPRFPRRAGSLILDVFISPFLCLK